MKQLFYIIIALSVLSFIHSCTGNNNPGGGSSPTPSNGIVVDSTIFFKVTFLGKTLCVYPIYRNGIPIDEGISSRSCTIATYTNSLSQTESILKLSDGPNNESLLLNYYNFNMPWKTCAFYIQTQKLGNILGSYGMNTSGYISDFSIGGNTQKIYGIEAFTVSGYVNTSNFTITSINGSYVTGFFTCILIDGPNRIPASGSFRLSS
jgi:hypothetical protein